MDLELLVKNVYSFSMTSSAWPINQASSKAVITCGQSARFEFRNVSIATVSGLNFVGCYENYVKSVGQFRFENSGFFGGDHLAIVSSRVLVIEKSAANLDRVEFISAVRNYRSTPGELPEFKNCSATIMDINAIHLLSMNRSGIRQRGNHYSATIMDKRIAILVRRSSISITQSWFKGNHVGLGGVIYDEFDSDITIFNSTFVNNTATIFLSCFSIQWGGIIYVNRQQLEENTVMIYHSKFLQNDGVVVAINLRRQ